MGNTSRMVLWKSKKRGLLVKSLKHNAVMNVILNISNMVFPLITYPYVARALLVEANGRLSFAQSIISYFTYASGIKLSFQIC